MDCPETRRTDLKELAQEPLVGWPQLEQLKAFMDHSKWNALKDTQDIAAKLCNLMPNLRPDWPLYI